MMSPFTWQEYLTTVAAAAYCYYLVSFILLYRTEIVSFFRGTSQRNGDRNDTITQDDSNAHSTLMGSTKDALLRENKVTSEEVVPQPPKEIESPVDVADVTTSDGLVVGSVADTLEEIKSLASGLAGSSKEEVATMFRQLLSRHVNLVGTPYQESLNLVIVGELADKCSINLETHEIATWWPAPDKQIVNNS